MKAETKEETTQKVENGEEEGTMEKLKIFPVGKNSENTDGSNYAVPIQKISSKCCRVSHGLDNADSETLTKISQSIKKKQKLETTQEKDKQQDLNKCKVEQQKCILRCNLQVKQTRGLISLEAFYISGSYGKDGLNQLFQFMRNQLTKPTL